MSKPVVSITDHKLHAYTHNVVALFTNTDYSVHYCTYIETVHNNEEVINNFNDTITLLGLDPEAFTFKAITWQDDF